MQLNYKDLASGAFFIGAGALYGGIAWHSLTIGSALNMGPGYFPIILSGILVILGSIMAIRAFSTMQESPFGVVPWRGVIMLSLATVVFAAFFEDLGMLAGVFVTTLLAALSSSHIHILRAVVISMFIAIFCSAVFGYGVRLPVPIVGHVFSF